MIIVVSAQLYYIDNTVLDRSPLARPSSNRCKFCYSSVRVISHGKGRNAVSCLS